MAALSGSTIASTFSELLRIGNSTLHATTGYYIKDAADTNSALSIAQQRVGIGTAAPANNLEIKGTTAAGTIVNLRQSDGNTQGLYFQMAAGTDIAKISATGTGNGELQLQTGNTTALTINTSANVGIGTSTPTQQLQVKGILALEPTDGANPWLIYTHTDDQLQFNANDGAGNAEMVIIGGSGSDLGNVGIGSVSPTGVLHIMRASDLAEATAHMKIEGDGYTAAHWLDGTAYYIGQNSGSRDLRMYNSVESAGVALEDSGDTSWGTFSDERAKTDISEISGALEKLKDVRCVNYRFKTDPSNRKIRLGVIAQDLIGKYDEVLATSQGWGDLIDDENEYYSVRYTELIPPLIKAVQELSAKVDALENSN